MNLPTESVLLPLPDAGSATRRMAAVTRLCNLLDTAFDVCAGEPAPQRCAAFGRAVRAALTAALADPALVAPEQREGSADTYRRHVIAADPRGRYTVATLVWMPGQASPVHAHRTWCGVAVLDGVLTESHYTWDEAAGAALALGQCARAHGAVTWAPAGRDAVHRLANHGATPAVSLHVYGVTAEQIATHVNDVLRTC